MTDFELVWRPTLRRDGPELVFELEPDEYEVRAEGRTVGLVRNSGVGWTTHRLIREGLTERVGMARAPADAAQLLLIPMGVKLW